VSGLPEAELAAISADLQERMPLTPSVRVEAAVRRARAALSGLDTAPRHASLLISRRAAAALGEPVQVAVTTGVSREEGVR
jgi:hypothetical protein